MGSSFFALLDDIATLLDDVSLLTKVAAQKTAGVLGDDLALNAQQVSGVRADRELPVVWAVAKGSFLNKLVLVPAALAISAIAPWAVTPLLMLGGAYLCFEGAEKLAHRFLHHDEEESRVAALEQALDDPAVDMVALEREKVRGAVRTDFILSAEIIVIALGTVAQQPLPTRLAVLAAIGVVMTVGVYGLVAGIVKLDDLGLWLTRRRAQVARAIGAGLLRLAPWLMKALSVAGTVAMFLVGGGILAHGIPGLEHALETWIGDAGPGWSTALPLLAHALVGLLAGALVLLGVEGARRLRRHGQPA
jgi:predicted DNA repair protein MutK